MGLGPRFWLLANFDLAVRLQMRWHHPNFAVGIAAVELAAAHLIVESDGVNPSRRGGCGGLVDEADAMVNSVPREHKHAAALLLAPDKDAAVGAAAEQRPARKMNGYHGAAVTT